MKRDDWPTFLAGVSAGLSLFTIILWIVAKWGVRDEPAEMQARIAALRVAGNALARHVAEDNRGQTARKLVQAWEEAAQ